MKKILIDPLKRYVKANLHCHTTLSDGYYTPSQIKEFYKKEGYQVVAFTDHECIHDNSYLNDEEFIALTSVEYSINQNAAPATTTYINKETWTPNYRDRKTIHLNLFSKDPHNLFHPACGKNNLWESERESATFDGYERIYTKESINETIKRATKAGFLVQYNHPNWSLNTREDYINMEGLWALEIYNYGTGRQTGTEYVPGIYDEMLRYGKKLYCTFGDDNHNWGDSLEDSFGGYDYIEIDEFTYENIMSSLEKGKFYASSGPIIKSLIFEDNEVTIECSEATDIILNGYNRSLQNVCGEGITKHTFKLKGDEVYFRITIKDKMGHVAHTSAYFLNELNK